MVGRLGIQNPGEDNSSPNHSIDNYGNIDFVLLQFDRAVDLNSISIGWVYNDADATVKWGNAPGAWNAIPAIDGQQKSVLDALLAGSTSVPGSGTGTRNVNGTGNVMSDFWIVSAADPNPNDGTTSKPKYKTDYFKLSAISVNDIPPIPEPATWMMMIVGFGSIAGMMRRQRLTATIGDLAAAG